MYGTELVAALQAALFFLILPRAMPQCHQNKEICMQFCGIFSFEDVITITPYARLNASIIKHKILKNTEEIEAPRR